MVLDIRMKIIKCVGLIQMRRSSTARLKDGGTTRLSPERFPATRAAWHIAANTLFTEDVFKLLAQPFAAQQ